MTAKEFIHAIEEIEPGRMEFAAFLLGDGYSRESTEEILRGHHFPQRFVLYPEVHDDPIIDLITNYQMTGFDVRGLTLDDKVKIDGDLVRFGSWLDDHFLAINRATGRIEAWNWHWDDDLHGDDDEQKEEEEPKAGHPDYSCAADSASFLDVLYELVYMSKHHLYRDVWSSELEMEQLYKRICTDRAGGIWFHGFYTAMFEGTGIYPVR